MCARRCPNKRQSFEKAARNAKAADANSEIIGSLRKLDVLLENHVLGSINITTEIVVMILNQYDKRGFPRCTATDNHGYFRYTHRNDGTNEASVIRY